MSPLLEMRLAATLALSFAPTLAAQTPASPARLTLERIFASGEFAARGAGQLRWLDDSTYVALQADPQQRGVEVARVNARTGARDVLVPAGWLVPNGATAPLDTSST